MRTTLRRLPFGSTWMLILLATPTAFADYGPLNYCNLVTESDVIVVGRLGPVLTVARDGELQTATEQWRPQVGTIQVAVRLYGLADDVQEVEVRSSGTGLSCPVTGFLIGFEGKSCLWLLTLSEDGQLWVEFHEQVVDPLVESQVSRLMDYLESPSCPGPDPGNHSADKVSAVRRYAETLLGATADPPQGY